MIIAIDPGTTESAYVIHDGELKDFGKIKNKNLISMINNVLNNTPQSYNTTVVCEDCTVRPHSGSEVGKTVEMIGFIKGICYHRCKFEKINRSTVSHYFSSRITFDEKLKNKIPKHQDGQVRYVLERDYGIIDGIVADIHQARAILIFYMEKQMGV